MKKNIILIVISILFFSLIIFSQTTQMYNYSIYSVLKGNSKSESVLGSIAVIQGYSLNFQSSGVVDLSFTITPLKDLNNFVRTKVVIKSENLNFEDTFDLLKGQKNYIASVMYNSDEEEKILEIYINVNDIDKLEFVGSKEEPSKENRVTIKGSYMDFANFNKDFSPEIELELNDMVFVGTRNIFNREQLGFYFGGIIKGLKLGIYAQNDAFYIFLNDKTHIDSFEFIANFVPFAFSDNSMDFYGDFSVVTYKHFDSFELLNEKLKSNFILGFGLSYFEKKYDFDFNFGLNGNYENINYNMLFGYNFISNQGSFFTSVSIDF